MAIWSECYICGLDFPEDQLVRHYKTLKLVDVGCNDEPTHSDWMSWTVRPMNEAGRAEQPVSGQGEQPHEPGEWYVAQWDVSKWAR